MQFQPLTWLVKQITLKKVKLCLSLVIQNIASSLNSQIVYVNTYLQILESK